MAMIARAVRTNMLTCLHTTTKGWNQARALNLPTLAQARPVAPLLAAAVRSFQTQSGVGAAAAAAGGVRPLQARIAQFTCGARSFIATHGVLAAGVRPERARGHGGSRRRLNLGPR